MLDNILLTFPRNATYTAYSYTLQEYASQLLHEDDYMHRRNIFESHGTHLVGGSRVVATAVGTAVATAVGTVAATVVVTAVVTVVDLMGQ